MKGGKKGFSHSALSQDLPLPRPAKDLVHGSSFFLAPKRVKDIKQLQKAVLVWAEALSVVACDEEFELGYA